jgi:tetratricopeptide (TPR) repeat protein
MHQPRKAIASFLKSLETSSKAPEIHFQLGLHYILIRNYTAALNHFNESLHLHPENVFALYGKGMVYYKTAQYEQAINTFLDAIELKKFFPAAHFQLAETLMQIEAYNDAAVAYETVCSQLPNNLKARKRLMEIYKHYLPDDAKYKIHREAIESKIKQSIIVVSGLIGSNASLLVKILNQAGYEVWHDDFKHPYFGEFSYSKVYDKEGTWDWIQQACGKVIKVEANYLFKLPDNFNYKLIYINRDKIELSKIQAALKNMPDRGFSMQNLILNRQQEENLEEWVFNKPNIDLVFIDYKNLIINTEEELEKIESLLETELNRAQMILPDNP